MLPILKLKELTAQEHKKLLARATPNEAKLKREVQKILTTIEQEGQPAVLKFTQQFDSPALKVLTIPREKFPQVDLAKFKFLRKTVRNLEKFARVQLRNLKREPKVKTQAGVKIWREFRPLKRVGIYAPGGLASYPSSVLMQAVPARIAGVKEIILATPPKKDGKIPEIIWAAAHLVGVAKVWLCGGAQAIGALALLEKVDKITGPGNSWVTTAKTLLSQRVPIDFPAGPSEVLILADNKAKPKFIAADLLAQAEHGPGSPVVLVTISANLAAKVQQEITKQLQTLPRAQIARQSLETAGVILLANDLKQMVAFTNAYAPEHLEIMLENPAKILPQIQQAGSVFLGEFTPTAVGDFASGTNHVLPTAGYARSYEALAVETFGKKMQVQMLSLSGLRKVRPVCEQFGLVEDLAGHARSVTLRLN